ncbi:TPA: transporter substrate-binding domain-containing protein [Klebsiella pneumoniae]|uniref:transporter substrate-binding domain-containing protein n=1 Tax=Klebsiella pneumoniae TaxID=573 RepID=UPI00192C6A17|nr:transporter substrate-binding domain-containing protein [Klebsiella pneumoniae]MBL4512420.1 transporter substrate-binding domain-containing protein [Klebsiella pneumoniae]MDW1167451.1 transporter substrate-binding domain-containing protein [Klebsiella pneumoniae]HCQ9073698.1 transporter substrate-binding domain-containing protein [Klebsiella pneumoniae]
MRKVLTVLLLSTLAIGTASAETLHFGTTTANPPFVTANGKNQPVGFDIDLAHALCQQMQAQCQFTAQRFDTLIPALRFKKFDAVIAGMEVIPMREKQVAFSRPYRQALSGVVIVNKDVAHTFADLKAKKVGVVKGTLHQRYLRDKQKAVQAVPYDDVASALAALKAGQITGVMGDFATLDAWRQENPDYAIMDERATDPAYYGKQYAIAVRKDDPELLNAINDALAAVMATPDFQQMQQKWFK